MQDLKTLIRDVPDFPKPGIIFKDITTLLKEPEALRRVVDALSERYRGGGIDQVLGIESRGFIFGPLIAYQLGCGFVPVRKPGKLPAETIAETYQLEYGTDRIEMHRDAVSAGQKVLIVDDLLATGGTARAAANLAARAGARIAGLAFVIELEFLKGREKLAGLDVFSLLRY
jgi:adenine phosphoribosyltransferase